MRRAWIGLLACACCALAVLGCGASIAPAFDARFADNDVPALATLASELSRAQAPATSTPDVLIATTHGGEPSLLAYDLAQTRVLWRVALVSETRPELLGDLVLTTAGGQLLALEVLTGQQRMRADLNGCAYLGAARDAARIFVACRPSGARNPGSLIALDARSGRRLWQREAHGEIGRPAAYAGIVLVPWQRQSLVLLDARTGRERARLRSRDDVIDWVRADGRGTFFGQRALYRLSAHSVSRDDPGRAELPGARLPGEPSSQPSAFSPEPAARSARGRIALYLEPEANDAGGVRIARDRFYFVFYRYVFAFDAGGALRWTRVLAHDAIAGQAVAAGLLLVQDSGETLLLSQADGGESLRLAVGVQLASATLRASSLQGASDGAANAIPLARGLTEIALDADSRLVPARAYALTQLAAIDAPEVTRELLDIYSQSVTPPELKRAAADALRTRHSGLEFLIDALLARYDFLEQTRPAPLVVIVPALIDAHETRAVPNLLERLADHETPPSALPVLVHAIVELGDASVAKPLFDWLRLYRADSSFAEQPAALLEAARGVLVHGGEDGHAWLASITNDDRTSPALASEIATLLQPAAAQSVAAPEVAPTVQVAVLPEKLGQDAINGVFAEHIDDVRACAIDEIGRNPELGQIRIAFIAESDGATHALTFAPNTPELIDCLYPKIEAYRFPAFRAGRQVATYVFAVRARTQPAAPAQEGTEHHWWDFYAAKAGTTPAAPEIEPWWRSHQWLAPMIERGPNVTGAAQPAAANARAGAPKTAAAAPQAVTSPAAGPQHAAPGTAPAAAPPATAAPAQATPATAVANPPAAPAPASEDAWWLPGQ